ACLLIYVIAQLWLPLRPYLQAQPAAWTGSGFNLAWQVMIAEKTGYVEFLARDPMTGERWQLPTKEILTPRQYTMMAQDPDLIRAMAQHLTRTLKVQGRNVEIRCDAFAALNGRPTQRLVDPDVSFAGALPSRWIVPLESIPSSWKD